MIITLQLELHPDHAQIVKLLLDVGADVKMLHGVMGATVTHEAVAEVIKVLVTHKNTTPNLDAQESYNGRLSFMTLFGKIISKQ
ncbi:hypothetical protein [Sphingobacterium sp. SYP-B4668]|uniref:hypothetical protein n=1 Tax=Sphingobacterium sp. SYP-B4668 TaxID=2996035 RepID=UPI0022DE3AC0|nr:hypothetical protein [Sphingobacterium sp. SYP-B4668]